MGIIYRAVCKNNGKCYIGKTEKTLDVRKIEHFHFMERQDYPFYRALRKHGWDSFYWEIIFETDNVASLPLMEQYYITFFSSYVDWGFFNRIFNIPGGYNATLGGDGASGRSAEARLKSSAAHVGNTHWKGKHLSEETKQKLSIAHKGMKHSKETLERMAAGREERKLNPPTPESKARNKAAYDLRRKIRNAERYFNETGIRLPILDSPTTK